MHFSTVLPALVYLTPCVVANPWGPPSSGYTPPGHSNSAQSWSWGPPKSVSACAVAPVVSAASGTASASVIASSTSTPSARPSCIVNGLGNGQDDGPNILAALEQCKNGGRVVLADYYSVDTLLLVTDLDDVEIELSGTLQYTPDIAKWSPQSYYLTYQNASTFFFLSGNNIKLFGGGTIDANGQVWWDALAANKNAGTAGGSSTTFERPIPLTVGNATNVLVSDIHMINSPFWFNFVYNSKNVTYDSITINAHSYSVNQPSNSDGWDIYRSDSITISNSVINNDDDCVSFKPNSTNIFVYNLVCNGSHGISVGSLGQYAQETDIVANIYVRNISMSNAQNGARIKVFGGNPSPTSTAGGGTGYVRNVTFEDFRNTHVDYPILIQQCYSTPANVCAQYPSKLSISDVHYINVTGTSSGLEGSQVVDIECSQQCQNITAVGTSLLSPNGTASYTCRNVASAAELDFPCSTTLKRSLFGYKHSV